MKQGLLVHNNWLLGGLAVAILTAAALLATLSGDFSLELAGLSMSLQTQEEGGLQLFFAATS